MYPRVTAIVVARNGGDHLQRTLDALRAQTRQPDAIIAVDCASTDGTAQVLAEFSPTQLIAVREKVSFGTAVATAVRVTPPPQSDDEMLWLLAQDTAPEPDGLQSLIGAVEVSPSVAVAGPKHVDWDDSTFIRELGESVTPFGATVSVVEDELDQAQHDGLSDVLAVPPGGMLVRHTVWEKLQGFDPALPVADDGLDFCIRVRLSGYRVVIVPTARVATAGDGVAGPSRSQRGSARRRVARERRTSQLHRRMVYAAAVLVPLHWITLVPLAIVRSLVGLVAKEPGAIGGELAAAFQTAFSGIRISSARRLLARNRVVGWAAIAPLRIPLDEVRRARALRREALKAPFRGQRRELNFFGGGGAWIVLGALVASVALFFGILSAQALTGGGLLPLTTTFASLWNNVGYGFRDIGMGFVGAADPFASVLAVLGSLTFWQPSSALVFLYFGALPLSALGAWLLASRLTERSSLRAFAAIAYAIAPMLFADLQTGRPAATLGHMLLPWLFFAGMVAARSWASAATTALLAAATIACVPSLAPALIVMWIVAIVVAGRGVPRILMIPIPTLALFAPLIWQQAMRGAWLALLADPGLPTVTSTGHAVQFVIGVPDPFLVGWPAFAISLGLPATAAHFILPVLLLPLGVLAVLSLFLRGSIRANLALVVALLGFASAVLAAQIAVTVAGSSAVPIWPGGALSLYWLGLIGAATIALDALGRFAVAPGWVAIVALAVAVAPVAVAMPTGTSAVKSSSTQTLPAVVAADASTHPRIGTLQIVAEANGGIQAQLIRGGGQTLNTQSTMSSTSSSLSASQTELARLAGNLASESGLDAGPAMSSLGVNYVLLAPGASSSTYQRALTALDGNPILTPIGTTRGSALWSYKSGTAATSASAEIPAGAGGWVGFGVLLGQAVIVGIALSLALPFAGSRSRLDPVAPDRPHRPKRARRGRNAPPQGAEGLDGDGTGSDPTDTDTEAPAATEAPDAADVSDSADASQATDECHATDASDVVSRRGDDVDAWTTGSGAAEGEESPDSESSAGRSGVTVPDELPIVGERGSPDAH